MKSELIYAEDGVLHITKPNGLRYKFENVDPPELGFDYQVLIYADLEVKIVEYQDGVPFDKQKLVNLTDEEKDAIELYIENSEPPIGVSLNQQHIEHINEVCHDFVEKELQMHGFNNFPEIVYAGREGSSHPLRSDARRVMEYADAVWCCYMQIQDEISNTREDFLKDVEEYLSVIPTPLLAPDSKNER
jgi:hypothetical protein